MRRKDDGTCSYCLELDNNTILKELTFQQLVKETNTCSKFYLTFQDLYKIEQYLQKQMPSVRNIYVYNVVLVKKLFQRIYCSSVKWVNNDV